MHDKLQVYITTLEKIIHSLEAYDQCLMTIQDNYNMQIKHKDVLLQGQIQMVRNIIHTDRKEIQEVLKNNEYIINS